MTARKTERLVNLVLCLLSTRRYLTIRQIRAAVPGYEQEDDEAFRRMFERDKDELRELGIPLETGSHSVWDDESGYRIARRDYELPEIHLEADEAAAVGLAARLWQSTTLAPAAASALLKLRAAGVDADPETAHPAGLEPRVDATETAFGPCLEAVQQGRVLRFDYRAAHGPEVTSREVEPWGVVSWRGRWYVVGHDRGRRAARVFRLSRVCGPVRPVGPSGAVTVPPGVDLRAQVAALAEVPGTQVARLVVRVGAAFDLRRAATAVRPAAGRPGWDEIELTYAEPERLADQVAGYGADVVVLAPAEARAAVVRRLRPLAGAGS